MNTARLDRYGNTSRGMVSSISRALVNLVAAEREIWTSSSSPTVTPGPSGSNSPFNGPRKDSAVRKEESRVNRASRTRVDFIFFREGGGPGPGDVLVFEFRSEGAAPWTCRSI